MVAALAVACNDPSEPAAAVADVGQHDAYQHDAYPHDANQPDASETDANQPATGTLGNYTSIFADPQHDALFVVYRQESGVRLFEIDEAHGWSEVSLPQTLREEPQVQLTSVVSTELDVLLSTEAHGAWRWLRADAQWQPFAPEWFDSSGRITHLRELRDQVYAFHEVDPNSTTGIELWQRRQLDWEFIRNDMFMIIDYLPRDDFSVRATRYGTVESSLDQGETWQIVPGVIGSLPPRIFEWGEDVAVATTHGVWISRDGAQSWQKVHARGGRAAALVGDEVVVADSQGRVSAVGLIDEATRELPGLPGGAFGGLQLGVSGQTLVAASYTPEVYTLTLQDEPSQPDPQQPNQQQDEWQPVHPAD
jgi:hypothetical protein